MSVWEWLVLSLITLALFGWCLALYLLSEEAE